MTTKEAINQLKDLRLHCADWADKDDPESVWSSDVQALDIAIATLREKQAKEPAAPQADALRGVRLISFCRSLQQMEQEAFDPDDLFNKRYWALKEGELALKRMWAMSRMGVTPEAMDGIVDVFLFDDEKGDLLAQIAPEGSE